MANNWRDIAGSVLGYFRLGLTGPRLKNSSGTLAVRNAGDSADAAVTAASLNKVTITTPDTGATLTIADGVTLTVSATASVSGTNSGNETTTTTGSLINGATEKTTPVDADFIGLMDSAASNILKKLSWVNIKTTAKTYFDTLYGALATVNTFTKAQRGAFVSLTDATTIAVDLSLANQFRVALAGNRTLGVPTNIVEGQQGVINIRQDTTGSRTLAYTWPYQWAGGTVGTLSTAGCTEDQLVYSVDAYNSGTMTTTIATPGVGTFTAHGFTSGQRVQITTTGALPTGLTANTSYYLRIIDANTFNFCTSLANVAAGTYIATSGSQSGVHTITGCAIKLALNKAYA